MQYIIFFKLLLFFFFNFSRSGFQTNNEKVCEEYSIEGDCLGAEATYEDRRIFTPSCSFGYKKSQSGKCRKVQRK